MFPKGTVILDDPNVIIRRRRGKIELLVSENRLLVKESLRGLEFCGPSLIESIQEVL